MWAQPTTTVEVWRDTNPDDTDGYGDDTETGTDPLYSNVPASIIEQTQRVPDPASGNLVPVSGLVGRVGGEVDVQAGDRLHDAGGSWYAVAQVVQPQNPAVRLDKRLDLRRTG